MSKRSESGFSLMEMLVSVTITMLVAGGVATMLVQNSRLNKSEKMSTEVQANARNCLAMIVAKLRSAGWDPMNAGIQVLGLDPDTTDDISQVEVFADLDQDGLTDSDYEQVLIRHIDNRVEWRPSNNALLPFIVLAIDISNDADGDGTIEPMFQPDSTTAPSRMIVQITAESPVPDPVTRQPIRYTLRSEVVLRKQL